MDQQNMTAREQTAYARGLDDGARRTLETIAASLAKSAEEWKRTSRIFGPTVATTLEGLAEALCATDAAPTPADALAQDAAEDAAEDEMVSNVKDRVFGGLLAQLEEDDIERMRRGA